LLDSTCDGLVCVEAIEHVPDVDSAIAEVARVVKPGGRAIVIDKNPLGVGYHGFYPNWLYKGVMESLGKWSSYPKSFPFKERWHAPLALKRRLRAHFSRVEIRYLDGRVKGRRRFLLGPMFRLMPFLSPDVAWCCQR